MRVERHAGGEPEALAGTLHALVAQPGGVRALVQEVVDAVRAGGDAALAEHAQRFDRVEAGTPLRVGAQEPA